MTKVFNKRNAKRVTAILLAVVAVVSSIFIIPTASAAGKEVTVTFDYCYDTGGNIISFVKYTEHGGYTVGTVGEELCRIYADGKDAYCIEPGHSLYSGNTLTTDASAAWNALSKAQKKAVNLALLFGKSGSSSSLVGTDGQKWIATQLVVWEFCTGCRDASTFKLSNSKFIDGITAGDHNPNVKTNYNKIIAKLNSYNVIPSFSFDTQAKAKNSVKELKYSDGKYSLTLTDSNKILSDYTFKRTGDVSVSISGICLIALLCWSVYGLFASAKANDGEYTMHNIITRINNEFNEKITDIKTDNPHDKLEMSGSKAEWKEVLAVYAVAYNMTNTHPANPDEVQVITLDESKEEYIRNLFWEINKIDHRIETYTETEQVEEKQKDGKVKKVNKQVQKKALYITVSHVDLETIMTNKGFTAEQKKMCRQLLSDENNDLWRELLHGVTGSNSDIVLIAQEQLGNVGGKPYWSWYGFSSRVEWCCCFVSWCANECGYIESGTIPMYSVVDTGVDWFKSKDQWLDGSEEPEAGMIIFFDWASDGLDGSGDHTGIVEKVENGIVYTIEGNSGDKVCENQYSIGNKEILGYGYYSGNNTVATGDAAQQVWTYLKSYGYSDSVAAGIIGNMMRECGGDTLNLDWNIIGHYNGDEFYGLCQWCLRYTPSGFKGSTIKEQCEYLQKTISRVDLHLAM